jgi:hypothetical protein
MLDLRSDTEYFQDDKTVLVPKRFLIGWGMQGENYKQEHGNLMSARTYTAKLKDRDVKITSQDLAVFCDMYLGGNELATRMSELLWLDIYVLDAAFGVSPHDILSAIKDVEHGEPASGVKPATQFKNMPLKGLWHKHYFSAHFLVQNIFLALGKNGLDKLVNEAFDPAKSDVITREMVNELAQRLAHEPFQARDAAKKVTGEWMVYLRRDGKNYYLCCNTHDANDQFIYDRIMEHCVRDFPDLPMWLKEQQSSKVA